jgi:hypothetical protein
MLFAILAEYSYCPACCQKNSEIIQINAQKHMPYGDQITIQNKVIIVVCASLFIAGCAIPVPYARKGTQHFKGGYEDKELGPGHYAIEIEGNGYTSYELAEQYFHRRAAELCNGQPYKESFVRTNTRSTNYYFTGQFAGATQHVFPVVVGEVKCQQ